MATYQQWLDAIQPRPVRPRPGEIGSLRQTLREIFLFVSDNDPDRERARLRARARATKWNRPLLDAYVDSLCDKEVNDAR